MVPRPGLALEELSIEQRKQIHRILSAALSSQGYLKATGIIHLDDILLNYYNWLYKNGKLTEAENQEIQNLAWGSGKFYVSIFGSPKSDSAWAFKLEGHHLSLNFTVNGNSLAVTPMFVGADPAEYPIGTDAGWRVLGQEEDLGIMLLQSMSAEQKKLAIKTEAPPKDIFTSTNSGLRLVEKWGIPVSKMRAEQKQLVKRIVQEYSNNLDIEEATAHRKSFDSKELDQIYFGWMGSEKESEHHYYIVNAPSFLIEFDNMGNHIHMIWHEKGNDFGEDLLKEHYQQSEH